MTDDRAATQVARPRRRSGWLRIAYYALWTVVVGMPLVADFSMGVPELVVWTLVLVAAVVVTYRMWWEVRRNAGEASAS